MSKEDQSAKSLANFDKEDPFDLGTLKYISEQLKGPFFVVTVLGSAREGKSTLLNLLAKALGADLTALPFFLTSANATVACTSGLQIAPHLLKLSDGKQILLMDAEGADRVSDLRELQIYGAALLLSHVCICLEPSGTISKTSVSRLGAAVKIAKDIANGEKLKNLRTRMPRLIWSIRTAIDKDQIHDIMVALNDLEAETEETSVKAICQDLKLIFYHKVVRMPANKEEAAVFRQKRNLSSTSVFWNPIQEHISAIAEFLKDPNAPPYNQEFTFQDYISAFSSQLTEGLKGLKLFNTAQMLTQHVIQSNSQAVINEVLKEMSETSKNIRKTIEEFEKKKITPEELLSKAKEFQEKSAGKVEELTKKAVGQLRDRLKKYPSVRENELQQALENLPSLIKIELVAFDGDVSKIKEVSTSIKLKQKKEEKKHMEIELAKVKADSEKYAAKMTLIGTIFSSSVGAVEKATVPLIQLAHDSKSHQPAPGLLDLHKPEKKK